jgi:membrane protein
MGGAVARARELYGRSLDAADRHPSLSAGFAVVRRDIEIGGTLLAGALAFRLFIWLLPCCLLVTALLGFTATNTRSPEELTSDLGMGPLTASMLGQVAAQAEGGRWVTMALGLVLLAFAGLTLGRALDRIRDRVWHSRADRRPKAALARALRYNLALLLIVVGNIAAPVVVAATGRSPGLVSLPSLVFYVVVGMVMLSVEWPPRWRSVWPGALLIAVGIEALHLAAVLFLPGKLARASELYGTLGVAASILLWLALMARLLVLGQVLNAVLAERAAASPPASGDVTSISDANPVASKTGTESGSESCTEREGGES